MFLDRYLVGVDIVGWALGIFGIALSIIFYFRQKRHKFVSYQTRISHVLGTKRSDIPGEIKIFFKDREIKNIYSINILIWNCGNESIRGHELVPDGTLRLKFSSGEIIKIETPYYSRPHLGQSTTISPDGGSDHEVKISFTYLDSGDGFEVEILCSDEPKKLKLDGSIMGETRNIEKFRFDGMGHSDAYLGFVMSLVFFIIMGLGSLNMLVEFPFGNASYILGIFGILVSLVFGFGIIFGLQQISRLRSLNKKIRSRANAIAET